VGSGQDNNRRLLLLQNWIVEEDGDARTVIAEMLESLKNVMPLSEENVFNFRVVMSELVNNEFRHGTGRNVHISISAFSNRQVEMYVYGSPKGFDLDGVLKRKERRGAVRKPADRLHFRRERHARPHAHAELSGRENPFLYVSSCAIIKI